MLHFLLATFFSVCISCKSVEEEVIKVMWHLCSWRTWDAVQVLPAMTGGRGPELFKI